MADPKQPRRPLDEDLIDTLPPTRKGGDKDTDDPMAKPGVLPFQPQGLPNEDDEPTKVSSRPKQKK